MTALLAAWLFACGGGRQEGPESSLADPAAASAGEGAIEQRAAAPACESPQPAPPILPGTRDEHRSLDYWLAALGDQFDLDEVLLSPAEVATLNAAVSQPREGYFPQVDLTAPVDTDELKHKLAERSAWLAKKFASGEYVTRDGQTIASDALPTVPEPSFSPRLQVALGEVPFYCGATTDGFYAPGPDAGPAAVRLAIDRNRCSTAHAQELIQVLAPWPNQLLLARTRYTWGFISADAPLSPPLSREHGQRFAHGPFVSLDDDDARALSQVAYPVPAGRLLPKAGRRGKALLVATAGGVERVSAQASALRPAPRPLTRRAVLTEAFRYLDTPYGFGGRGGGRDCSRLLLDIFESFGLHLPRHSAWQSRAGSYSVELDGVDEDERLRLLDAAAARGVVIMHLPGHIMLYLGRDGDGRPMALHAFAEYMDTCPADGGDVLYEVDRVQVSDLELGRGTSKRAFLARIDRLTVFGRPPDEVLASVATRRPAAPVVRPSRRACRRAGDDRVLFSPARPDRTRPLRVIATAAADPGPAGITLIDPRGEAHTPALVRLGGPPYGYTVTIDEPKPGRWLALFGDGDTVYGCERVYVSRRPRAVATAAAGPTPTPTPAEEEAVSDSLSDPELDGAGGDLDSPGDLGDPGDPASVWDEKQRWSPANEDLYAVFVERLFDYSIEEDLTWPSLDALTRDASRNLLYDHLGQGEDEHLVLRPDCADLPYTLRAYFAWKLGLPFGFRKCDRARPGDPPRCDPGADNLLARAELNIKSLSERQVESQNRRRRRSDDIELSPDVVAFARFVDRELRRTVHSSSGRTHPDDDDSDFYPVPLTRRALRPGTLFTDPYGHLLVIADWIPQRGSSYGVLVGADAQPDGTVGRRRFWRGSFLFDPDVDSGGAGFKAFRPWQRDPDSDGLVGVENRDLRSRRLAAPYSREQYQGSADDFYDSMNALINPRPLDPVAVLETLVDALDETVSRRVTSVQNGEAFMRDRQRSGARGPEPIEMPEGADIFLTTGPWENYSTPARDLRLLISIDTVVKFPDAVARRPTQFGIPDSASRDQVTRRVAALRQTLAEALAAREFSYTRSDGSQQRLTLADLVERQQRLEMAYNPNDCVEIRWAAAPGSAEMSTCQRHAPAEQRARMESHRPWFEHRKRPAN